MCWTSKHSSFLLPTQDGLGVTYLGRHGDQSEVLDEYPYAQTGNNEIG